VSVPHRVMRETAVGESAADPVGKICSSSQASSGMGREHGQTILAASGQLAVLPPHPRDPSNGSQLERARTAFILLWKGGKRLV